MLLYVSADHYRICCSYTFAIITEAVFGCNGRFQTSYREEIQYTNHDRDIPQEISLIEFLQIGHLFLCIYPFHPLPTWVKVIWVEITAMLLIGHAMEELEA